MISQDAALRNRPIDNFAMVDGSRAACQRHNATMNGVKANIMNGLSLEPGDWNIETAEQMTIGVVSRPEHDGVALLLVGGPEQAYRQHQENDTADSLPVAARKPRLRLYVASDCVSWQMRCG